MLVKTANPKRLYTGWFYLCNIFEMTQFQEWRIDEWLPGLGVGGGTEWRAKGGECGSQRAAQGILMVMEVFPIFFFFINLFILFFYFWLRWVFVAARRLSLVAASGGYSSLRCTGFSLRWLLLLRSRGSRHMGFSSCGSRALERRLSSCGARAQLLHGMWDLPGPGLKPVSPALAGGFSTTVPPGKSLSAFI